MNGKRFMNLRTGKSCWQQDITKKESLLVVLKAAGIMILTAWLYYRTMWAVFVLLPIGTWHYREFRREIEEKKEAEFQMQFREAIQTLASSLNAGYSVENAFYETQKELTLVYPPEARISKELLLIVRKLKMHVPIEQILEEFAGRTQTEDVRSFSEVFSTAKRSGGDMIAIIRDTTGQISDKLDVKREIDTILAAKRYEFRIMSAVPYLIIGYMSVSFPEFMECLYGNIVGIGVMTGCLAVYISAYFLGIKLIKIEV